MASLSSYSKVWAVTHREAERLFEGPVVVQEKVDGSQFSFGNLAGELHCRSKGQQIGFGATGGTAMPRDKFWLKDGVIYVTDKKMYEEFKRAGSRVRHATIGDDGDLEWLCAHGVGHGEHVHTCDGCCMPKEEREELDARQTA